MLGCVAIVLQSSKQLEASFVSEQGPWLSPLVHKVQKKSHFSEWQSIMVFTKGIVRMGSYNSEQNCKDEVEGLQNNAGKQVSLCE